MGDVGDDGVRTKLLVDAHRIAPSLVFTADHSEEEIRRLTVIAYMGPDPCINIENDMHVIRCFKAMVRSNARIEPDPTQRPYGGHLRAVK
ncbi:hypothetical protein RM61_07255 [Xanthomonas phaseoli pv. phaseoli]|nr:hypothetical protein RM61_07255 [Xanthomonas phaseoli pv. phaseoli]